MNGASKLTPNEIRNAKFSTSLRGFKREEVEEFLNHAADALEDGLSAAADYQERYTHLQEKHEKLTSIERTLKSTLLEAKKSAASLMESARADAKDIIAAARDKQRAIENKAVEQVDLMQKRIEDLSQKHVDYQDSLSEVITGHLKTIQAMHVESPEIDSGKEALSDIKSDIKDDEIDNVVEFEAGEAVDTENATDTEKQPALQSALSSDENNDYEVTKTWRTIQETDTDGPALTAALVDTNGSADLFNESELEKYESDGESHTETSTAAVQSNRESKTPDKKLQSETTPEEKTPETVVDQIARAVRSARSAPDDCDDMDDQTTPVTPDNSPDEDTLYKKLAREHESEREVTAEAAKNAAENTSADPDPKKKPPQLPGPGPDGILVFGRKEDRERSVEENVKVLRDLDSVIDRFTEELEDIRRK